MIDKITAVTLKKTPNILLSAQQSATQNKIKPIASAMSVTTVSALERKTTKKKLWYLTNQLTTTASDKPERIKKKQQPENRIKNKIRKQWAGIRGEKLNNSTQFMTQT